MEQKQYLIDGFPASALDVIKEAEKYDEEFSKRQIRQTSVAAHILRKHGRTVGHNYEPNNS